MSTNPIWGTSKSQFETRPLPSSAAVCVVGLGGSGLATAERLVAAGVDVVAVDAGAVAGAAAGANGGFLLCGTSAFYDEAVEKLGSDRAASIYEATRREIDRMVGDSPRTGSLRIASSPEELDACGHHRDALKTAGFDVDWYTGSEGAGLLLPDDTVYQPFEAARATAERIVAGGGGLHENTRVLRLRPGEVETDRGVIICDHVIVAVDGLLSTLVPGVVDRARPTRLQMLGTAPADRKVTNRAVYQRWGMEYYQQLPDGRIALGGFRDGEGDASHTTSTEVTPEVQGRLEDLLRNSLGVEAPVTHRWAATASYTDGILPICEEIEPGLAVTGAYNGTGNVIGRLCGRALADLYLRGHSDWLDFLQG